EQSRNTARHALKLTDDLKRQNRLVADQQSLVDDRKKNVVAAQRELEDHQTLTAKKLTELRRMSDEVFDLRVRVRNATVANQGFEREIRTLEGQRWLPFVGNLYLLNREER